MAIIKSIAPTTNSNTWKTSVRANIRASTITPRIIIPIFFILYGLYSGFKLFKETNIIFIEHTNIANLVK